ncbi:MAG: hypothetical protein WA989_04015, partial [Henriciella sp.]
LGRNPYYRAGLVFTVSTAVALIWVSGGVGVIGSESNIANLVLLGLLPLLLLGALIVRFRAREMSITLSTIALLQFAIAGVALLAGWGRTSPSWPWDIVLGNAAFSFAWLACAWLFSKAAAPSLSDMPVAHKS